MGMDGNPSPTELEETHKLIKAAEELVLEIENGTAPAFGIYRNFGLDGKPCCAMGHIFHKAGFAENTTPCWAINGFYAAKVNLANDLKFDSANRNKIDLIKSIKDLIDAYKTKLKKFSDK